MDEHKMEECECVPQEEKEVEKNLRLAEFRIKIARMALYSIQGMNKEAFADEEEYIHFMRETARLAYEAIK